jgi:hypothetical protein
LFVWDPRNYRVLVSPWVVEQEVTGELRRLHKLGVTTLITVALGIVGAEVIWVSVTDLRLRLPLVLAWLFIANRLGARAWELATRTAIRRWRSGFRGRIRKFGLEHARPSQEESAPDLVRVVCTFARYTRVTPDGSLTDEIDQQASWGYWIPGLGYLGWGLDSADAAREAAIRRIAGQLIARRDDQTQPPVATDIREQEETWFTVQFWPVEPGAARPQEPGRSSAS